MSCAAPAWALVTVKVTAVEPPAGMLVGGSFVNATESDASDGTASMVTSVASSLGSAFVIVSTPRCDGSHGHRELGRCDREGQAAAARGGSARVREHQRAGDDNQQRERESRR